MSSYHWPAVPQDCVRIHLDPLGWVLLWPRFEAGTFPLIELCQGSWNVTQLDGQLG